LAQSYGSLLHITLARYFPNNIKSKRDRLSDAHASVFIAAKNVLVAVVRDDLSQNVSELLWILIQMQGSRSAFIGAFYWGTIIR